MTTTLKVLQQGETYQVATEKAEGGKLSKCIIVLQELGGKFENVFVATMLGKTAECRFYAGDLVAVSLRFQKNEHDGQIYQDVTVKEIRKITA